MMLVGTKVVEIYEMTVINRIFYVQYSSLCCWYGPPFVHGTLAYLRLFSGGNMNSIEYSRIMAQCQVDLIPHLYPLRLDIWTLFFPQLPHKPWSYPNLAPRLLAHHSRHTHYFLKPGRIPP